MTDKNKFNIELGQEVFWTDPEGLTSGYYTITAFDIIHEEANLDDIVLLSNGHTELEAFVHEIS